MASTQNPVSAPAIPVLETPRLRLRPHVLDDFEFVAAMWGDPDVVRYIGTGQPMTREEAWNKFQRFPGHWQWTGFGSWAIEERASSKLVGETGFLERRRLRGDPLFDAPEIGWGVVTNAAGKGYATEAVNAVLAWGREHFGPVRVVAITAPENFASIRVAEKCDFTRVVEMPPPAKPRVLLERIL